jgi:hypothetical protein
MLRELARKLQGSPGLPVRAQLGDLSLQDVDDSFRLVYCVYHTLFYADSREQQRAFFVRAGEVLAPGGAVAVEAYVPDDRRRARWARGLRLIEDAGRGVEWERYEHDEARQTVRATSCVMEDGLPRYAYWEERYLSPDQMDEMAHAAGLVLHERWGGYRREPFEDTSQRCLSVYRRGAAGHDGGNPAAPGAPGR